MGRLLEGSRLPGCLLMMAIPGASSTCLAVTSRPNENIPTAILRERSLPSPRDDREPPPLEGTTAAAAAEVAASCSAMNSADG